MNEVIAFVSQLDAEEEKQWVGALAKHLSDGSLKRISDMSPEQKQAAKVAIVANPDPKDLLELPNLKWIHSVWAGVERMVAELSDTSFDIVRLVDPELARTMSEAVLAWTLYLHRGMPAYAKLQAQKKWQPLPYRKASQTTVGILGLGALGARSALRLSENGFQLLGWSRSPKSVESIECLSGEAGFRDILSRSDILVVLLPLTAGTRGLLSRQALTNMKPEAAIINFARGPIIDVEALVERLDGGHLSHAVLDVFATEPLETSSNLWEHPDITVLPHISAPTDIESAVQIVSKNINYYLETGQMPEIVDRQRGY